MCETCWSIMNTKLIGDNDLFEYPKLSVAQKRYRRHIEQRRFWVYRSIEGWWKLYVALRRKPVAKNFMRERPDFINPEIVPELTFVHYDFIARSLTEEQPLHLLDNIKKRGPDWHLDHIISVREGWLQSIPVATIAHLSNLRVVPKQKNRAKGNKRTWTNLLNEEDVIEHSSGYADNGRSRDKLPPHFRNVYSETSFLLRP